MRLGQVRAWIAEVNGVSGGHVAVSSPGDDDTGRLMRSASGRSTIMEFEGLFTDIDFRGAGLGKLLLQTATAWIRAQGCLPVLQVMSTGGPAVSVYGHLGWVELGRVSPSWLPPEVALESHFMFLMMLPDPDVTT